MANIRKYHLLRNLLSLHPSPPDKLKPIATMSVPLDGLALHDTTDRVQQARQMAEYRKLAYEELKYIRSYQQQQETQKAYTPPSTPKKSNLSTESPFPSPANTARSESAVSPSAFPMPPKHSRSQIDIQSQLEKDIDDAIASISASTNASTLAPTSPPTPSTLPVTPLKELPQAPAPQTQTDTHKQVEVWAPHKITTTTTSKLKNIFRTPGKKGGKAKAHANGLPKSHTQPQTQNNSEKVEEDDFSDIRKVMGPERLEPVPAQGGQFFPGDGEDSWEWYERNIGALPPMPRPVVMVLPGGVGEGVVHPAFR